MNIVPKPYKLLWSVLYVVIINPISIEKLLLDPDSTIVPNLDKLSRSTFDTLYYRRQINSRKNTHSSTSSCRGQ